MTAHEKQVNFWNIIRKVSFAIGWIFIILGGCFLDSTGVFFILSLGVVITGCILFCISMASENYLRKIDSDSWED